jgi:hypothetical protein
MAFQFSGGNIVQPAGFGEIMGGFTGPAELMAAGVTPFSQAIAQEKRVRAELMGLGMQEAASTKRTAMNNEAAKELAKTNNKHSDDSRKRTALQALALAPSLAAPAGGFAGQRFGVGGDGRLNSVQAMTQDLQDENDLNDQLWRNRQNVARWGAGSAAAGAEVVQSMPRPGVFGS